MMELSRGHQLMLAAAGRNDAAEDQARAERAEAWRWECVSRAEEYREAMAGQLAAEISRQHQAEQADLARQAERIARAEDHRLLLLASGEGRWRTVGEVLAAARGCP